jgi:sucrose-6-phosphate hydrolase SacC (GH32 family)
MTNLKDNYAYLFVHFINSDKNTEDSEQIYFSVSKDGLKWDTLNAAKPILTSKLGDLGVRDPFIIRSPKEDKFYIIGTDLSIHYRGDWAEVQRSGSQSIMVWESTDLVNWSEQRMVKVGHDTAGCVWAPEAIYDKETEDFLVFWASRTNYGADKHRIFCSKTKDFKTFTEPQVYIERENDVIDTTIIEEDGRYYRFSKDETTKTITAEVSDSLLGKFTNLETNLKDVYGVEGPECFKMKGENRWCLLLDHFAVEHKYFPYYTTDLNSAQFIIDTKEFHIPVDAKHGGVTTITMEEYNALVEAYR